jgi:hypothetical protein
MRRWLLALDPIAVVVFAAIGRNAHREATSTSLLARQPDELGEILETASPFLIGMVAGWVTFRAWRDPGDLRTGTGVLAATVAVGMTVRQVVTDRGTPLSFIVVATLFLGLFLLGWRVISQRFRRDAE